MNLFKEFPFSFEDTEYMIKVMYDDEKINVAAFLENHPANGFRHLIQIPKRSDARKILENYDIDHIIEICRKDISEKRWKSLSAVIEECTEI